MLTMRQAVNEIGEQLLAVWGERPLMVPNVEADMKTPADSGETPVWARLTLFHTDGEQLTLAGGDGSRKFSAEGFLVVQTFTPLGKGATLCYDEAELALSAFRGKATPSGVWFRRARVVEVGSSGAYYQINVQADFEYEQRA